MLTRHSADEYAHARLWTDTIIELGGEPHPVRATYQSRLGRIVGAPASVFHVLALSQVFERRVYRHFTEHLRRPGTHPVVQATLQVMLEEEKGHLTWVRDWLKEQAVERGAEVNEIMRGYAAADVHIYHTIARELGWKEAA